MTSRGSSASRLLLTLLIPVALLLPALLAPAWAQTNSSDSSSAAPSGPVRLRQPQQGGTNEQTATTRSAQDRRDSTPDADLTDAERLARYRPGEFEQFIQRITNDLTLRRYGSELVLDPALGRQPVNEGDSRVPPDYVVAPGDELLVTIWGSVDADLRLLVDRAGRINIPRVGTVLVSGLPLSDIASAIDKQARKSFKNFEVSVSIGQLRNIRVFVTGFATKPGAYTVSALSTLSSVLFTRAGGPAQAGSFRNIELRRGGKLKGQFDLYELMIFGRREADQALQADDVIHVGPVSRQVALVGSVNKPAIFELKSGETVADLVAMGGGLNSVAGRAAERAQRSPRARAEPGLQRRAAAAGRRRRGARLQCRRCRPAAAAPEQARAHRRRGEQARQLHHAAREHRGRRHQDGRRHDERSLCVRHRVHA